MRFSVSLQYSGWSQDPTYLILQSFAEVLLRKCSPKQLSQACRWASPPVWPCFLTLHFLVVWLNFRIMDVWAPVSPGMLLHPGLRLLFLIPEFRRTVVPSLGIDEGIDKLTGKVSGL